MTVSEKMATELANKKAEREALRGVIQQWNANRLDLFELSEPNEDLEFHGVMRFYFQDSGQKVATKCIRVASDATSQAVIETLIEKFRPDMRMLSVPEYALYEIHENGEERKLGLEEKPLLVQLNWHIDDREGRFLLRRIDDKTNAQGVGFDGSSFRRKLSKREKKQMKKQEKLSRLKSLEQDENAVPVDQNGVAEKLYIELPETSFTRSISNPEAVMRRRRQQKLEKKLQQFRSKDGGPDTGGTLKIYGEALCKDVPYKTLLLSVRDSAVQVVREMLAKYGLDKVDPQQYCLVQVNSENNVNGGTQQEYILDDDECPLAILMNHPSTRGSIMFHVRRRPADYVPRKRKKKPSGKWNELDHNRYEDERLPFLLELNPDGSEIANGTGVRHRLQPNVTEVGSERPIGPQAVQAQTLTLTGPTVMPRHCVIAFTENIVTLTPCSRDAHTYVNNQRIHQTTILQNGAIVKFGRLHTFKFIDPAPDDRIRQRHDSTRQIEYGYERRSPDLSCQETNMERYGSVSGTPNNGQNPGQSNQDHQVSQSSSLNKSTPAAATHCHNRGSTLAPESTHNYETTFDLDGNVETASLTSSRDGNRTLQNDRQPRGTDPILPAVLEFLEETEETFFHAVITDVEPSAPQFKLAPTYTLYLAARYRASTHYRPELQPTERAHRLTIMLANVATMIQRVIQERYMDASSLALWLANGSELLHMLKNDRHVGAFSTRAQDILTDAVHTAFASLVRCISLELAPAMSQFMADADEPAKEAGVVQIFSNTMALLRRCRVNAALTIQLFSHLFHTINATAFNALVSNANLCVRWFGRRLKARLNAVETWAERQGLELASQCHLATIMQATHLLQAPKYNAEELAALSSTCFKLNSLQVRALLQKYQPAADEPRLPAELIENVVRVAESVADTLARADGREIRLEEEPTLALALLLPEDGYSCEVIRGVPPGLAEFLAPLQRDGLCRMAPQLTSSGYWTIYMIDHHNNFRSPSAMSNRSGGYSGHTGSSTAQPEIQVIKLHKSSNGMGLSIVAAKGAGQDRLGIYIKSVVAGGAADADGRLTAGDQLLKVDGQSLVGITQEKAAEYLVRTGPIVTLEVAKQGAIYHGLATLLSQPSPVMTRAHKNRPKSEHLEASTLQETNEQQGSTAHSADNLSNMPWHAPINSIDPVSGATLSSICSKDRLNLLPDHVSNRFCVGPSWAVSRNSSTDNVLLNEVEKRENGGGGRDGNSKVDESSMNQPILDTSSESVTLNGNFSLDSIPYIDQTDETTFLLSDESENVAGINSPAGKVEYSFGETIGSVGDGKESMNDFVQEREQETLIEEQNDDKMDDETMRKEEIKVEKDTFWKKTPAMAMPELSLDLSGLDSDASSDVSSLNKCWKSPEEVRLGCGGRVAALTRRFSKLSNVESINQRFGSIGLLGSSIKFASDPNFARVAETHGKDEKEYRSELDLREAKGRNVLRNRSQEKRLSNGKRKLSLSEQRYLIEQLKEMSNFDDASSPSSSSLSSAPYLQPFVVSNGNNGFTETFDETRVNELPQSTHEENFSRIRQLSLKQRSEEILFVNDAAKSDVQNDNAMDGTLHPRLTRTRLNLVDSLLRPRRMSERDLPSRLGREAIAPQQQIHASKSVPTLHNVGTDNKQQHEVFNPGYSRASSSNSITPPVTQPPPPMTAISSASLRSRSSHNLHDQSRVGSSSGLVSRQQSSPNLNPGQTTAINNGPNATIGTGPNVSQSNEAERFYQNLSIYRNRPDDTTMKQRYSPPHHLDDRNPQLQKNSRGSQNSLNRPTTYETGQPTKDRPMSAYVAQPQQQSYFGAIQSQQQQVCPVPTRSQSSRDIIRQEAKLQEMQEEVRRRELRSGILVGTNQYRPSAAAYNLKSNTPAQSMIGSTVRGKAIGSQPNLGSSPPVTSSVPPISAPSHVATRQASASSYGYSDTQYSPYMVQYGKSPHVHPHQHQHQSQPQAQAQHQHSYQHQNQLQLQHQHQHQHQHQNVQQQQQQSVGHAQYGQGGTTPSRGKNDSSRLQPNGTLLDYGRDHGIQNIGKSYMDHNQHVPVGSQYYLNPSQDIRNDHYNGEGGPNKAQNIQQATAPNEISGRPVPDEEYTESPPPPPPSTSTHPLYSKQSDPSRYTASTQDPPRGGYYPANAAATLQQRQYQYSASNPWQREEREREQALRREAARQWRDQQIAELSALSHRTSQQEEQLRALQLERDFQKRAEEEVANQQDDDEESNDLDTESIQRVQQGVFRATMTHDRSDSLEQQHLNMFRTNTVNQTVRGNHNVQSLDSHTSITHHGNSTPQQCLQQQQDSSGPHLSADARHEQINRAQNNMEQISQKPLGLSQSTEDKEIKRKQVEFDDTESKKKEEESEKQQQTYQQQHHLQQSQYQQIKAQQMLHPSMLRLDNLSINGTNASFAQNGNNEAPLPPERGSSYAVMSQQSALRSNSVNPLTPQPQLSAVKRVSFHDPNANMESMQRNLSSGNLTGTTMDVITEDPNTFINDAEMLLASPKTPEGSSGVSISGNTPGVIGAQEVYKDPRTKRLAEKQKQQQNSQVGHVPEKLSFKEKMKMFAMETGEDGTPRDKQRQQQQQQHHRWQYPN